MHVYYTTCMQISCFRMYTLYICRDDVILYFSQKLYGQRVNGVLKKKLQFCYTEYIDSVTYIHV